MLRIGLSGGSSSTRGLGCRVHLQPSGCFPTLPISSIKPQDPLPAVTGKGAGFMGLLGMHGMVFRLLISGWLLYLLGGAGACTPSFTSCPASWASFLDQETDLQGRRRATFWKVRGRRNSADQHQGLGAAPPLSPRAEFKVILPSSLSSCQGRSLCNASCGLTCPPILALVLLPLAVSSTSSDHRERGTWENKISGPPPLFPSICIFGWSIMGLWDFQEGNGFNGCAEVMKGKGN